MAEELTRIIDLTSSLTEEKLVEMIRELRFGKNLEKLHCPHCGAMEVVKRGRMHNRPYVRRYYCKKCGRWFNDLTGTIFGKRLISIRDIILIAYLLLKLGMSISAISRELRISRKTVQRTAKEIMRQAKLFRSLLGAFPPAEVDEAYQNAGLKGIKKT